MTNETDITTESPIAEYRPTEAVLADLRTQFGQAVFDVRKPSGMVLAKDARKTLRRKRVELEEERVRLKEPVLERGRVIDAEAKRIIAEIQALEQPIDQQIKAEENRKDDERRAREQAELDRIAGIQERIAKFSAGVASLTGRGADVLKVAIERLTATEILPADYSEFVEQATAAKNAAIAQLVEMHTAQVAQEAEAVRLQAERAELEQLRAQQAEAQRVIEENNRRQEEEARAERARQDAAAQEERDRLARIAEEERQQQARADEERRQAEAAERAEVQRVEDERRAEAQRVHAEAIAAERKRIDDAAEALRLERARLEADALANVTLHDAAVTASAFLHELGHSQAQATRMLDAALSRDAQPA